MHRVFAATASLAFALGALTVGLRPAHADEPVPPDTTDPDAYPPGSARVGLALVGLGATAVWYGAAAGMSFAFPDAPGADDLRIPVAGPWMALADTGCSHLEPNCSAFTVVLRAVLTVIDGVGQVGGVLVATEALFLQSAPAAAPPPPRASFSVSPVQLGSDGLGLSVHGIF